ncbi:major tail protein [Lactococcus cremoris subsp. cremoris TIFN6]|uniref:Major tail protein n=1 Tax=Lactococcus cremoris subsp. cremoris TIFN6 TaxID=1234876 RepID=T0S2G6_LACLC|nr:major tail protein [Lactococcus cremoris subsp. cremoris TIFN6]
MATVAGLLSKGAVLSYRDTSGSKTIAAVKSIPAMGADPEKVDVTHLGSAKKAYIAGIQDSDNLEFAIIYQGDNFKDVDTLVKAGKAVEWTVTYSDGMKVDFTGQPSYKFDGVEVNQALGFNLVVVVSAGPNFTPSSH